ncbi:MAG: methyltransferase domain-containing protein [Phycisphaerae bacterium]|nr:methyltransferase domain-containing protein [Phycisphaerae bacterium]
MVDKGAQAKWDHWARAHPDLLLSVERGPDLEQTKLIAEDVARKLELGPEDDLLDVGCGSGLLLSLLRTRCRSAVGVDFASGQLALGRGHFPELAFAAAAAEELPFPDGRFSRLLCYGVWHYVEKWQATLDSFLRLLRRPGIVLIGDVPSLRHKWRLYLQYAKRLPALALHPKTFLGKLKYSHDTSHWHWVDLGETAAYVESRGCRAEVLAQPREHRQYGGVTHVYRFDLKIRAG